MSFDTIRRSIQDIAEALESILEQLDANRRPLDRHWKRARLLADQAHLEVHRLLRDFSIHHEVL